MFLVLTRIELHRTDKRGKETPLRNTEQHTVVMRCAYVQHESGSCRDNESYIFSFMVLGNKGGILGGIFRDNCDLIILSELNGKIILTKPDGPPVGTFEVSHTGYYTPRLIIHHLPS